MWRKILRAVFVTFLIVAAGAAILIGWLTSPSFDRFVAERINRELAKMNIRAEINRVDVHPFDLTVQIHEMRLFAGKSSVSFFEFADLEAELKILDLFSQHFELHQLKLSEPTVNLFFDEQGRSNIADIDLSPFKKERVEGGPDIKIGRILIENGSITYNNQKNHTNGETGLMEITLRPEPEATWIIINANDAHLSFNDRRLDDVSVEINTALNQQGAEIERVRIVTPFADAVVSGRVRGWSTPEYELSLTSTLNLAQLTRDLNPGVSLTGTTEFTGKVTGQGSQFRLTGTVSSAKLGVSGVQLLAFRFEGQGGHEAQEGDDDLQAFLLRGLMQSNRIQTGLIDLDKFRGSVLITPEQIDISRFSASTLQGMVAGDAAVRFAGNSTVEATFRSVDLHQAVAQIAKREFPVAGQVNGQVRFNWPGTNFQQIAGRARVGIEPPASEIGESLPTSGTATVLINRRGFDVTESDIAIGVAQANVTGLITWHKAMELQIDASFQNLVEEERFLKVLEVDLGALTRGAVTSLSGTGTFSGRVASQGAHVSLSGVGTIRDLDLHSGKLLSGRAEIEYQDRVVELTNATASFEDGSRATLALFRDELDRENGIALRGQVHQMDLGKWWDRIDFSLPVIGSTTGDFDLTGLPGAPRGQADFVIAQGRLQPPQFTIAFDRLTTRFAAMETGYELQQLKLERGPNVFTLSGSYHPQTQEYSLIARGLDLDVSQFNEELEKRGYSLTGRLNIQLSGSGKLARPEFDGQFQLAQLTISGREAGTVSGEVHAERGDIRWTILSELFDQQQTITGRLDLSDPAQPLTLQANLNQFQAKPYFPFLGVTSDIELILTGRVDFSYPLVFPERRRLTASLSSVQANFSDFLLTNESALNLRFAGSRLEIGETQFRGDNTNLKIGGSVDFGAGVPGESVMKHAQLNLAAEGTVNLGVASALYAGLFTGGVARIQASLRGTLSDPNFNGTADIENASLRLVNFPVAVSEGRGRVRFTQDRVLLEQFNGKANEGDVKLDGGLLAKNFQPQQWRFNIRATDLVIRYPEGWRSVLDGELSLQGSRSLQVLSGFVNVQRTEYTRDIDLAQLVLERETLLQGTASTVKRPAETTLALDVRVQATDSIFIRNNLANAQGSAWLHVGGTWDKPVISGRATATRGTVELRNQEYEITTAWFEFPNRPGQEIRFNAEAQADISGYQVFVGFSGTPSRFKPTLRSEPPLPSESVLSLITTGRADTISQETRSLAQSSLGIATSLISEALSQQLEQRIARQRFFGINRFQVEPLLAGSGADPTARITVGQQITKDLSISYSVNVASNEEPIVILEYKLTDRFYLVGARDDKGEFSIDFRIRKRF